MLATNNESPVHLMRNGKKGLALLSLNKFGFLAVDPKYTSGNACNSKCKPSILQNVLKPLVWKPFLIVTGLQIVQQFAMMGVLNKYMVTIFQDLFQSKEKNKNTGRDFEPYLGAVLIGKDTKMISYLYWIVPLITLLC